MGRDKAVIIGRKCSPKKRYLNLGRDLGVRKDKLGAWG